ncbi:MAG: beta-ketoacyl-[acyl-carrier-protein] synthase family protein [Deltaproteobacteria bacterium]|nr:beta-ketoacyl-[acyl-carrier-protein] synthase family protein [Deltaproteobacteria bacterium]
MNRGAPVAITGTGCLSASGESLMQNMKTVFSGKRAPGKPGAFSSSHPVIYPVFEIKYPIPHINDQHKKYLSRTAQLALAAAAEAIMDAGLDTEAMNGLRVGVCMGTTVGSTMNDEKFYRDFKNRLEPDMSAISRYLNSNPSSVISKEYSLKGPCQTIVNACSSGTDAIGIGASWIRSGICDIVIAGGADELSRISYNGFISLMITDSDPCRPFDKNRKGLNLGEGAGLVVLESEYSLKRRNKRAKAFVIGYGSASDGYHLTAPHPEGRGLKRAIADAFIESGKKASDIGFINAHGTATPENDLAEARVLREIFSGIPFLSTKGYTGHTLGAAGAIEAVYTVASLEAGQIPVSAGFSEIDPYAAISPVTENTGISLKTALSESLAFGGQNAVLILTTEGI